MLHKSSISRRLNCSGSAFLGFPRAVAVATVCFAAIVSNAHAQQWTLPAGINLPIFSLTDEHGINLTSNKPTVHINDVSIGAKEAPLSHSIESEYPNPNLAQITFVDSFSGRIDQAYMFSPSPNCAGANSSLDVHLAGMADRMCGTSGGSYVPQRGTGSGMVNGSDGTFTYTQRDGTRFLYGVGTPPVGLLARITAPDGRVTTMNFKSAIVSGAPSYRLQSVTRNDGLQLKYTYASNATPTTANDLILWTRVASVTAINNAIDYCDPLADSCTYSQAWPVASQTWTSSGSLRYMTAVDAAGRSTRFTMGIPVLSGGLYGSGGPTNYVVDQLLAVRAPTSTSADTMSYTFCAVSNEYNCMHQGVKKVTVNGIDWTYTGTSGQGGVSVFIQLTSARAGGGRSNSTTQQVGNSAAGPLMSYSDGLRSFQFDTSLANRLSSVTQGDGDKISYLYDDRGNITQETHTPSTGSTLAATVRNANFDTSCVNPLTCNKPNWVKDARGNQTDYLYDPDHGGVLKVTSPAVPSPIDGTTPVRPQVRYTYERRYAWYKNASGDVVQAATPIWVRTAEKFCRKTSALSDGSGCMTASDEVTTTYDYGPTTGVNNLFLRGEALTADGLTLRTCYGNDIYGNRISQTTPKAGLNSCP